MPTGKNVNQSPPSNYVPYTTPSTCSFCKINPCCCASDNFIVSPYYWNNTSTVIPNQQIYVNPSSTYINNNPQVQTINISFKNFYTYTNCYYNPEYFAWTNMYGQLHNEEGPAKVYKNGSVEFWLNGEQIKVDNQVQFLIYLKYKELW